MLDRKSLFLHQPSLMKGWISQGQIPGKFSSCYFKEGRASLPAAPRSTHFKGSLPKLGPHPCSFLGNFSWPYTTPRQLLTHNQWANVQMTQVEMREGPPWLWMSFFISRWEMELIRCPAGFLDIYEATIITAFEDLTIFCACILITPPRGKRLLSPPIADGQ